VLPSLPVIVTWVAFTAVTVSVDEPPDAIEAGLAVIVTPGGGFAVTVTVVAAEVLPPAPVAIAV
jgi:predicted S18 family serine protease